MMNIVGIDAVEDRILSNAILIEAVELGDHVDFQLATEWVGVILADVSDDQAHEVTPSQTPAAGWLNTALPGSVPQAHSFFRGLMHS